MIYTQRHKINKVLLLKNKTRRWNGELQGSTSNKSDNTEYD